MKANESSTSSSVVECEAVHLWRLEEDDNPIELVKDETKVVEIPTLAMEDMLESHLATKHTLPVEYPKRYDLSLLQCRQNRPLQILEDEDAADCGDKDDGNKKKRLVPFFSIMGILEDHYDYETKGTTVVELEEMTVQATSLWCPNLRVSAYTPTTTTNNSNKSIQKSCCGPAGSTWERSPLQQHPNTTLQDANTSLEATTTTTAKGALDMAWIDLRSYQRDHHDSSTTKEFFLPTLASMTFFLRSLLGASHTASPWCPIDDPNNRNTAGNNHSMIHDCDVVAVLLSEVSERLIQFRVGDVCPSWYLYSTTRLDMPAASQDFPWMHHPTATSNDLSHQNTEPAVLLIYRRMPPRDLLSCQSPLTTWQQRFASKLKDFKGSPETEKSLVLGCLWETYFAFVKTEDKDKNDLVKETKNDDNDNDNDHAQNKEVGDKVNNDADNSKQRHPLFRMAAPPYLNYAQDFPVSAMEGLLESIDVLRKEALGINQHWTPWPEKQHYKAVSEGAAPDAKPWTVFPLCYCFPANAPENLQWIPTTCALVPKTKELLRRHLGRLLRTALFSRLDPETQLHAHTGWADLANHVVRLHLPLVVPPGGLCGTWVDGCVETHQEGKPLVFDDSKVHRAFNYSQQERIVLILDLARPSDLPLGTATGGHTDELDQFIAQMSQVS